MEYYWGYAAASNSPLSNPFAGKPRPIRSNSSSSPLASTTAKNTAATTPGASSRYPRFAGHSRTQSTDSGASLVDRAGPFLASSSSHESGRPVDLLHTQHLQPPPQQQQQQQQPQQHRRRHEALLPQIPPHRTGNGGNKRRRDSLQQSRDPSADQLHPYTTDGVGDDSLTSNSNVPWWQIGSQTAPLAPPARPASASASTPERASVLRKPPPGSLLGTSRHHPHHNHGGEGRSGKHKQLPPIPRPDAGHNSSSRDNKASPPAGKASPPDCRGSDPPAQTATVSLLSPSVAALAAACGAALPLTPASPTKAAFAKEFSLQLSSSPPSDDRRQPPSYNAQAHPQLQPQAQPSPPQQTPQPPHHPSHQQRHAAMSHDAPALHKIGTGGAPISRAESASSASGTPALSARTMLSTDASSSAEGSARRGGPHSRGKEGGPPFVVRNGRTYIADPNIIYPLPIDLPELHRQSMRMLLLFQLFGRPVCSPALSKKPPTRVLDIGCGSGFWSMMCHRWYSQRGHPNISFTGLDVVPVPGAAGWAGDSTSGNISEATRPDKDMKWQFVQHNIDHYPWPFQDGEFDLIMLQNMSLCQPVESGPGLMDEIVRLLQPGGTVEVWESDHTIRMLRPHVPESGGGEGGLDEGADDSSEEAAKLGAYVMTNSTPMSSPLNNFLVEYNSWLIKALDTRSLTPVPCTNIESMLVQEEQLTGAGSRRLAVPFSEVKWEREGVGGVVTKDGKSYIETRGTKGLLLRGGDGDVGGAGAKSGRVLSAGQAALRRTALMTVVQLIQSLEPLLREASGKSQDEWDGWQGKMMNDLLRENGTSWGECLEVGVWWARKRSPSKKG